MREGSMAGSLQLELKISCCEVERRCGDVWIFLVALLGFDA